MPFASLLLTTSLSLSGAALAADTNAATDDGRDTIVVTASPIERVQDDLTVGASVLTGEELDRLRATTIGETLRTVPGVSATGFGAGASRPIIRGQGGNRVRVLANGIGSIDASSASPDHAVAVEPALAERIEVIRGTGLLRYGSSGAGGVINVIDGRIPTDLPEGGLTGALRATSTSVDEGFSGAAGVTGKVLDLGEGSVLFHISGAVRDADDYEIPGDPESARLRALEEAEEDDHEDEEYGPRLDNSFVETDQVTAGLSFVGSRGFLGIAVSEMNSEYGIPGGHEHHHDEEDHDGDDDNDDEDHEEEEEGGVFIALDQTRLDLSGRLDFLNGPINAVTVDAGYASYEHREIEPSGEVGTLFSNDGWEARVEALHSSLFGGAGAVGVQALRRDFSAFGEEAFVPPTVTDQYGIYTFQEAELGGVLVDAAMRYEHTEHEPNGANPSRSFDGISASLGATYDVTEYFTLSGNIFRTERAPTSEELYSDGPHLATDAFELGDVTLDEEVATGAELIAHLHNDRGFATVNLFATNYDGYIYERETGLEEDELPVFQFTGADADFYGAEFEGGWTFGAVGPFELDGDLTVSWVETDLDGGDTLPRIPPVTALVGLDATWDQVSFRAEADMAAEQDDTAEFELATDSYTLVNLYADWELGSIAPGVTLSAALKNATDEEARLHTSFLKDVVPLQGRSLQLSLRKSF